MRRAVDPLGVFTLVPHVAEILKQRRRATLVHDVHVTPLVFGVGMRAQAVLRSRTPQADAYRITQPRQVRIIRNGERRGEGTRIRNERVIRGGGEKIVERRACRSGAHMNTE